MNSKLEFLLTKALSLSPSERALIAHSLITSLDEPVEEDIDREWLLLAEKRMTELETGQVSSISWEELKKQLRHG